MFAQTASKHTVITALSLVAAGASRPALAFAAQDSSVLAPSPSADSAASSSSADDESSPFGLDLEVDPFAFLLSGHSAHLGIGLSRARLEVGTFGADLPEWMHGNVDVAARIDGVGVKLDVFPLDARRKGLFVGLQADHIALRLEAPQGAVEERDRSILGGRVGWRFALVEGLYVSPWLAVTYTPAAADRAVGERVYREQAWGVTPTAHLGYRWR